jgi:hypothetical protein
VGYCLLDVHNYWHIANFNASVLAIFNHVNWLNDTAYFVYGYILVVEVKVVVFLKV